jgi:hypothetical protein
MAKFSNRDSRTGKFQRVDTSNTALSAEGRFQTQQELEVRAQGADQRDLAYDLPGRATNNAAEKYDAPRVEESLGVKGSPLRSRNPKLVPSTEQAETIYGMHGQGEVGRVAAARGDRRPIAGTGVEADVSRYLTGVSDHHDMVSIQARRLTTHDPRRLFGAE